MSDDDRPDDVVLDEDEDDDEPTKALRSRRRADEDDDAAGVAVTADEPNPVQQLSQAMNEVFMQTQFGLFQTNPSVTGACLVRAKDIVEHAGRFGPELAHLFGIQAGLIEMTHGMTEILKCQLEARFDEAQALCEQYLGVVGTHIDGVEVFARDYPEVFAHVAEITLMFYGYRAALPGFAHAVLADRELLRGNIQSYLRIGKSVVACYRQAHQVMIRATAPEIAAMREMFYNLGQRFSDRLRVAEVEYPNRSRYIQPAGTEVFIIHGHDHANRDALAAMLTGWGAKPALLVKQASRGRTVIQKFEDSANNAGFAIALFTPDDFVGGTASYVQARPNVLFEFGWFHGRYGPERVCVLLKRGTHVPSDLRGIICLEFDASVEECREELLLELTHAGVVPQQG